MRKPLHIVSFDFPHPPVYGGIIDVFYKIKSLHQLGVKVHLHYFAEKEIQSEELSSICESVHFYPKSSPVSTEIFSKLPLRMLTRRNKQLIQNLAKNNFPILYEGLHTSHSALTSELKDHKKFLRCHNAEAEYAAELAKTEKNFIKKNIFKVEEKRTQEFERNLIQFDGLFVLSEEDRAYFQQSNANIKIAPIFHAHEKVEVLEGIGDYVLFHGNLSVNENLATAEWISNELSTLLPKIKFKIAGKSLDSSLENKLKKQNVECVLNPSTLEMKELIQAAQIVLLKTSVPSGIKLKLIDSLAYARHIISDNNSVQKSQLSSYVSIANTTDEYILKIQELKHQPTSEHEVDQRNKLFKDALNNQLNATKIIQEIY
ncbi:hypothetical protein NMK71_10705 [Weeksellaceae bacterium KMM 9713]|uniref:Mannosyltransferase n=1 Tax=Profundicola chukchiensis TaxID=2961959 RepID=A0A9X4RXG3_9FLAO|nr:hypothetical protein [Profundicola chukchiensis]MDG4946887.1 hypothetical protein [Profundicola chukchiensis]